MILIPVSKHNGSVPHWAHSWQYCASTVASARLALDTGYEASVPPDRRQYIDRDNWAGWLERQIRDNDFNWVEPVEFNDTYVIGDSYRGRSASGVELISIMTGGKSCMMLRDLVVMLKVTTVTHGQITGRWFHKKRGANYLIEYVGPTAP